jgi:hypothetical protein
LFGWWSLLAAGTTAAVTIGTFTPLHWTIGAMFVASERRPDELAVGKSFTLRSATYSGRIGSIFHDYLSLIREYGRP